MALEYAATLGGNSRDLEEGCLAMPELKKLERNGGEGATEYWLLTFVRQGSRVIPDHVLGPINPGRGGCALNFRIARGDRGGVQRRRAIRR